jgi:hypothetical protein
LPLLTREAYVVYLEIRTPNLDHSRLYRFLQSSEGWWHYTTNMWIVLRKDTLSELNSQLIPLIYQNDRMLVMPARGPVLGWLAKEAWDWLNKNLPQA